MSEANATGGGTHEIDDETGNPYWKLWGEGWKDSEEMDINEAMTLDPRSFPPGTRILVIEPDMDDPCSVEFYDRLANKKEYYPLNDDEIEAILASNDAKG